MNREQRRKAKKRKEQNVPQPVVHYVCDPEKNTQCKKTFCHINGGPCCSTRHLEYAKQPVTTCRLMLPVDEEMAEALGLEVEKS